MNERKDRDTRGAAERSGVGGGRDRDRGDRDRDRDRDDDKSPRGRGRRGGPGGPGGVGKRKVDPFIADKTLQIDWRDAHTLTRFITERGKIVPRRVSGVTAKNQRKLAKAIKTARQMGLLPYGGHRTPLRSLV